MGLGPRDIRRGDPVGARPLGRSGAFCAAEGSLEVLTVNTAGPPATGQIVEKARLQAARLAITGFVNTNPPA